MSKTDLTIILREKYISYYGLLKRWRNIEIDGIKMSDRITIGQLILNNQIKAYGMFGFEIKNGKKYYQLYEKPVYLAINGL